MDVKKALKKGIMICDGAMGTMLQEKGLKIGELPETYNITAPELIMEIHKGYIAAGANIITTNTFGANKIKLKNSGYSVEEIIHAGVSNAQKAIGDQHIFVALDIGPLGELLEPMGSLSFEEAYEHFKTQVIQGVKSGVDLVIVETMTDLYEAKAAILAVKENSELPVFCTMSFEENMRTFTGCSLDAMVMVLQGLGVDALGVNCSLGPKELEPILDKILEITNVPVIVQANAGLPDIQNGETIFNFPPQEFGQYGKRFAEKGVRIIGGCCGTTYQHITALVANTEGVVIRERANPAISGVCTPTKIVLINELKIIGERINPTGKKAFKEALKTNNMDYILSEAIHQVQAGADILDVNVGLPEIDEVDTMSRVIKEIQAILDVPLQIDSNDPHVIEKGLRIYNGKAIVNSVTGDDKILDQVLPVVKKYGAAVIGLTLDENGIPSTAEGRFKIAEKIVQQAKRYGIDKEDVYIDCLTLTAAAQQDGVQETLKTLRLVKERLNVKTVLGVSNISFGLPNRDLLNRTFLVSACTAGLDLPIINPLDKELMDAIKAFKVLSGDDINAKGYIELFAQQKGEVSATNKLTSNDLFDIIVQGIREQARTSTNALLKKKDALDIIEQNIVPALDLVGKRYEKGDIFLPQLIQSAETVKESFKVIRDKLGKESDVQLNKGKIILATVKGDIHDIGKNIVKVLLESYGFQVVDLGKDVDIEVIVREAKERQVKLVGLSALMTTTVKSMEETIIALKEEVPTCLVMVGGAVLNQDYANMIGANFYAKDAKGAVSIAQKVYGIRG